MEDSEAWTLAPCGKLEPRIPRTILWLLWWCFSLFEALLGFIWVFVLRQLVDSPPYSGRPIFRLVPYGGVENVAPLCLLLLDHHKLTEEVLVLDIPWPPQEFCAHHSLEILFQHCTLLSFRDHRCYVPHGYMHRSLFGSHSSTRILRTRKMS